MTFRRTIGLSLALLVISAGAMAKPVSGAQYDKLHNLKAKVTKAKGGRGRLARSKAAGGRLAVETRKPHIAPHIAHHPIVHARFVEHPHIIHPHTVRARIVHLHAIEIRDVRHRVVHPRWALRQAAHEIGPRTVRLRHALLRRETEPHREVRSIVHYAVETVPIGRREIGRASWYGGRHVGRRTASGAVLDRTHPTLAHRTLPFNTLVRVTNLRNGRSVVAVVNDRGPVSPELVADLSPETAELLHMKQDGIVPVAITPVAVAPVTVRSAAMR